jgi:hypothetical protein
MYSPKQLKQDLVYSVKTLQKAGKMLSVMGNLWVVDGHYKLDDTGKFDPFDALVVVKDFPPSIAHADPKSVFNISSFDVIAENTKIPVSDLYRVGEGFCCVHSGESDSFYDIGCYLREKFKPFDRQIDTSPIYEGYITEIIQGIPNITQVQYTKFTTGYINTKAKIYGTTTNVLLEPKRLLKKRTDGSLMRTISKSPVFETEYDAFQDLESKIRAGFEAAKQKRGVQYSQPEVLRKLLTINYQYL